VTLVDLDPLAFILHILGHFSNASRLVCSLRDAMVGRYLWLLLQCH
jgi:hypothetical protein